MRPSNGVAAGFRDGAEPAALDQPPLLPTRRDRSSTRLGNIHHGRQLGILSRNLSLAASKTGECLCRPPASGLKSWLSPSWVAVRSWPGQKSSTMMTDSLEEEQSVGHAPAASRNGSRVLPQHCLLHRKAVGAPVPFLCRGSEARKFPDFPELSVTALLAVMVMRIAHQCILLPDWIRCSVSQLLMVRAVSDPPPVTSPAFPLPVVVMRSVFHLTGLPPDSQAQKKNSPNRSHDRCCRSGRCPGRGSRNPPIEAVEVPKIALPASIRPPLAECKIRGRFLDVRCKERSKRTRSIVFELHAVLEPFPEIAACFDEFPLTQPANESSRLVAPASCQCRNPANLQPKSIRCPHSSASG